MSARIVFSRRMETGIAFKNIRVTTLRWGLDYLIYLLMPHGIGLSDKLVTPCMCGLKPLHTKPISEANMAEKEKRDVWVRVKDDAGNEFICPLNSLKDRQSATDEELDNCVDDAIIGRYAAKLDIEE